MLLGHSATVVEPILYPAPPYNILRILSRDFDLLSYIYNEKRELQLVFTLSKGFAIPATSRKTTDVHARYANPPRPFRTWTEYKHIHEDIHRCCSD